VGTLTFAPPLNFKEAYPRFWEVCECARVPGPRVCGMAGGQARCYSGRLAAAVRVPHSQPRPTTEDMDVGYPPGRRLVQPFDTRDGEIIYRNQVADCVALGSRLGVGGPVGAVGSSSVAAEKKWHNVPL
jgi:hypothetical protein